MMICSHEKYIRVKLIETKVYVQSSFGTNAIFIFKNDDNEEKYDKVYASFFDVEIVLCTCLSLLNTILVNYNWDILGSVSVFFFAQVSFLNIYRGWYYSNSSNFDVRLSKNFKKSVS